jgi:hypothetical protein
MPQRRMADARTDGRSAASLVWFRPALCVRRGLDQVLIPGSREQNGVARH